MVRSGQDASAYGFSTALRVGVVAEKVSLVGSRVMERAHSRGVRGHLVLVIAGAWRLLLKAEHTFRGHGTRGRVRQAVRTCHKHLWVWFRRRRPAPR